MTLAKRASDVEEKNLSPKEAVILWMQEAHQFDSLVSYGCWLAEQPLSTYPLMRIPKQVAAAVRAQNKGVPQAQLQHKIHRAQKDALFLFHVQEQLNERVLLEDETRHLKLALLKEKLLTLVYWTHSVDRDRLDSFQLPDSPKQSSTREPIADRESLDTIITRWPQEEALFWGEVTALLQAERLLSERYFSGEHLFFPETVSELTETQNSLDWLFGIYESILEGRPPESEEEFGRWLMGERPDTPPPTRDPEVETDRIRPDPSRTARAIAEHVILMARAETLDDMDDRNACEGLVQKWLQGQGAG